MEKKYLIKKDIEIKSSGEIDIEVKINNVLKFIVDINKVVKCIPDLENINSDFKKFNANLCTNINIFKFNFNIDGTMLKYKYRNVSYLLRGADKNNEINIYFNLKLKENNNQTKIFWNVTYELQGFISVIGNSIIKKKINAEMEQTIINIKKSIEKNN